MMRILIPLLLATASLASAAGPVFWDCPADVPFGDGSFDGAGLTADGALAPGLRPATVLADSSLVVWDVGVGADGRVWAGSGHDGRLWRLDGESARVVAQLPAEEVFAVAPTAGGVIAGCGPGGQVFRVQDDGVVESLATVPGGYVWDVEVAADGRVFLATGSPGVVYAVERDGTLIALAELPCSNLLDLAITDDGSLLVAGQGPGRVFHVQPGARRWTLLLALEQDEVRQVVRGPDGWYALGYQAEDERGGGKNGRNGGREAIPGPFDFMVTADAEVERVRSALYRLDGPSPLRVWQSEHVVAAVAWSDDHGWLAAGAREDGGPARLDALVWPNARRPLATWEGGDVVALTVAPRADAPDAVFAAQAHPGRLTRLVPAAGDQAVFVSAALDGRHALRWGRLGWVGAAGGEQPRFAVRVGMSPTPDPSWSDWIELGRGRDLDLADVPRSRCLQWRATLPVGSRVDRVSVSGYEPNLAPVVASFGLEPAGELRLGSMMPGQENVTQHFESGLKVEYNLLSRSRQRAPRERAASLRPLRTLSWHATDPNEDLLRHRLFVRQLGDEVWRLLSEPTREQVYTWDTATVPDGWYELRLVTDDGPGNPGIRRLSAQKTLGPLPVDNTPPELDGWELSHRHDGFALALSARDRFDVLAGAEIVLPDGSRERLDPVDGICDSDRERFAVEVPYPGPWDAAPPRPWTVRVRVWDLQGNLATVSGVLP
jgi:hypothetical protein